MSTIVVIKLSRLYDEMSNLISALSGTRNFDSSTLKDQTIEHLGKVDIFNVGSGICKFNKELTVIESVHSNLMFVESLIDEMLSRNMADEKHEILLNKIVNSKIKDIIFDLYYQPPGNNKMIQPKKNNVAVGSLTLIDCSDYSKEISDALIEYNGYLVQVGKWYTSMK